MSNRAQDVTGFTKLSDNDAKDTSLSMRKNKWTLDLLTSSGKTNKLQQRDQSQGICLPQVFNTAVSPCAISCLQTFVQDNYLNLSCSSTADLSVLCSQQTVSGLTIGEAAFECQSLRCPDTNTTAQSGYDICKNVTSAIPETVSTFTATVLPIPTDTTGSETSTTSSATFESSSIPAITTDPTPLPTFTNTQPPSQISFSGVLTASINSSNPTSGAGARGSQMASGQMQKTGLSTVAIASIAAGGFIILIVALCYLSYWFRVRKRDRNHDSSRRISAMPAFGNDHLMPPTTTSTYAIPQLSHLPNDRFESNRRAIPPSRNIGLAVTSIDYPNSRTQQTSPQDRHMPAYWPAVLSLVKRDHQSESDAHTRSRSVSPFYEDLEAQDQELPALRNSRSRRSSSRSANSGVVEKPAPLRLSKNLKPSAGPITMQLTPTYDNGTYSGDIITKPEPVQYERPPRTSSLPHAQQTGPKEQSISTNVSQLPLPTAQPPSWSLPASVQVSNYHQEQRPNMSNRKQSDISDRSASVYTVIEEDESSDEVDRYLNGREVPAPAHRSSLVRDLQWPSIPKSVSTAKEADIAPRPWHRPVRPIGPLSPPKSERDRLVAEGRSFLRTETSSSDNSSVLASSFPLPPVSSTPRNDAQVVSQISHAMRAATANTYTSGVGQYNSTGGLRHQVSLSGGSSRKQHIRGFRPLPSIKQSPQPASTANFATKPSPTGEMYFTVHL